MARVSRRTDFTGSALVRLLAQLSDREPPEPKQAFADRLSQWLAWTDAVRLSAALDSPSMPLPTRPADTRGGAAAELARVRDALVAGIADERRFVVDAIGAFELSAEPADFKPYRHRYFARQQAMEAGIAPLRTRLRAALAARSEAFGRLAAVDAVMAQALGPHERRLLATVPTLLEAHFVRAQASTADAEAGVAPQAAIEAFANTLHALLLAELEIRLQPVEGLLDALRAS